MELKEFAEALADKVFDILGDGFVVKVNTVIKNNSTERVGLSIAKDGERIAPNIYVKDLHIKYRDNIEKAANEVLRIYSCNRKPEISIEDFMDWDWVKEHLYIKLVNTKRNADRLKDIPHDSFMDLSIVFAVLFDSLDRTEASVLIKNEHLALWGIQEEELKKTAYANAPVIKPPVMKSMTDTLIELNGILPMPLQEDDVLPMYVLSNAEKVNGAAVMAYSDIFSNISAKIGDELYIIPSSVHEVIIIPKKGEAEDIKRMISVVNTGELDSEDVLSDSLYQYSKANGLSIVA